MSFVEVKILTGRTHQIRAHFSEQGNPLVGDPLYGGKQWLSKIELPQRQLLQDLDHQLLHAYELQLTHPKSASNLLFQAKLPEDFKQVLTSFNFSLS